MHQPTLIGTHKKYNHCRVCNSIKIHKVIDLGDVPLAGGFLIKKQFSKEKLYPLTLNFCTNCYLLQTENVIDKDILFKNYFYYSSKIKTLVSHFQDIINELALTYPTDASTFIIEIGANDGSFIKQALKKGFNALGIDPAKNIVRPLIAQGLPIINTYFTQDLAEKVIKSNGRADVVFSSNTLAHIENINDVFEGIHTILKEEGILIFEVHYLQNLILEKQYDMIYHEHQYYYSLHSIQVLLDQHNLVLFDASENTIHAGTLRCYVQKKNGLKKKSSRLHSLLKKELQHNLTTISTFKNYQKDIIQSKKDIYTFIISLKTKGKTIAGYGASGRGTILSNFCGLTSEILDVVIDDSPVKQGLYMPGIHVPIVSSQILLSNKRPDYVVLFAWSFWEEIIERNKQYLKEGGNFILPLPNIRIIKK